MSTRRNLLIGLKLGVAFATAFSLGVTVLRALGAEPFDRLGVAWSRIVLLYFVSFGLGGIMIGIFLPLRRFLWGSMLLGFLFVFPVYLAAMLHVEARSSLLYVNVLLALGASVVTGGALGLWNWYDDRKRSTARD